VLGGVHGAAATAVLAREGLAKLLAWSWAGLEPPHTLKDHAPPKHEGSQWLNDRQALWGDPIADAALDRSLRREERGRECFF